MTVLTPHSLMYPSRPYLTLHFQLCTCIPNNLNSAAAVVCLAPISEAISFLFRHFCVYVA